MKIKNIKNIKNIFGLIIFISLVFYSTQTDFGCRVFKVKNPSEIYVDLNKNLIFDEQEPVILKNIYYINENTDYSKYPILQQLTDEEKFFLEYMANETAQNLLKNRYVKVKNGDILIRDKSYSSELFSSGFIFDDSEKTQKALLNKIRSINLDEYVILNLKNKKYHKLSCESGRKSNKYKIVRLSDIAKTASPCKSCHIETLKNKNYKKDIEIHKPIAFNNDTFSSENIKIFFIDLNKTFKPDNLCKEKACKALLNEINTAKTSIDFAVYGINNQPKILKALIDAHKRGVKIRRVYDYSNKKYYEDNDKLDSVIKTFMTDEIYDKTNSSALMHNKYFIFDNKKVYTGSSNISSTDLSGFNANYTVLINSEKIAQKYKEDFDQMYKGIFHKGKTNIQTDFIEIETGIKIKPVFSPQNKIIDTEIIPLINSAKQYIYVPAFFITHKGIKESLINAHKRGIEIKIINDATNAHTNYTIHKELRKAGIKVKTENYAGKMHAKSMILDNKYTVIGSMNYTKSGNSKNDENALIIDSTKIAEFMRSTFLYLWNKIPEKYEIYDPKAESTDSIGSCFDGLDNDFDDKIDNMDSGCSLLKK